MKKCIIIALSICSLTFAHAQIDYIVTAPYTGPILNTCGATFDCGWSDDHIYEITIPYNGNWTFSTCGAGFDTEILIGSASCSSDLGYNDDFGGCAPASQLTVLLPAGTYYVTVRGWWWTDCGTYSLSVNEFPATTSGDLCASPIAITCGNTLSGNTALASPDIEFGCEGPLVGFGIWYSYVGAGDNVTASLCTSSFDTYMKIFSGPCSGLVCTEFNDDYGGCGLTSEVTFTAEVGVTYRILVQGFSTFDFGAYSLSLTCSSSLPSASLQDCNGAPTICSDVTISGNASGLGNYNDLISSNVDCLIDGEHQTSWYYFQAQTDGTYAFDIVTSVDYDFAIWQSASDDVDCVPSSSPIRCSFAQTPGNTGLNASAGIETSEDYSGDRFVAPIVASAGDVFMMIIDNYTADNTSFDLNWTLTDGASLDCTTLPIILTSFSGKSISEATLLEWSTSSEINNDYFTIERSKDGISFTPIGEVNGSGNSSIQQGYSFIDASPFEGLNYYRLRQTDFDGRSESFNPISVYFNFGEFDLSMRTAGEGLYTLHIHSQESDQSTIAVYDMLGKKVYNADSKLAPGVNSIQLDLSALNQGFYSIRIENKFHLESTSFLR